MPALGQATAARAFAAEPSADVPRLPSRRTDELRHTARRSWAIVGGVALLVVIACTVLVRDGVVSDFERDVFHAINDLPDALEPPMVGVQYLGVAVIPFVVAIVAAVFRKWYLVVAALLVYPLKLFVEKVVLKEIVYRGRPGSTVPDAILRHAPARGRASRRDTRSSPSRWRGSSRRTCHAVGGSSRT